MDGNAQIEKPTRNIMGGSIGSAIAPPPPVIARLRSRKSRCDLAKTISTHPVESVAIRHGRTITVTFISFRYPCRNGNIQHALGPGVQAEIDRPLEVPEKPHLRLRDGYGATVPPEFS
jgi:hypothetical protein